MTHSTYRIVVGMDFSDTAELALDNAFLLASREPQGEVHVLNAVQHLGDFAHMHLPPAPAYRLPLEEAQEKLEAAVGARLSAWQSKTGRTISRCVSYLSVDFPVVALTRLATDLDAQLIVVGTHGRRGVRRFLLGSVAEAMVRESEVPVLVVRPPGTREQAADPGSPCPECVATRKRTLGRELWCAEHLVPPVPRRIEGNRLA